jgi:hypothetical protein
LAGSVDAAANVLEAGVTRSIYPMANVTVSAEPNWDEGILKVL